jgi:hypothetical protein
MQTADDPGAVPVSSAVVVGLTPDRGSSSVTPPVSPQRPFAPSPSPDRDRPAVEEEEEEESAAGEWNDGNDDSLFRAREVDAPIAAVPKANGKAAPSNGGGVSRADEVAMRSDASDDESALQLDEETVSKLLDADDDQSEEL